jgi:hypothetical protein
MNFCRLTTQEPIFSVSNTEFEGGDDGHGHGDHIFLVKQAQPSHILISAGCDVHYRAVQCRRALAANRQTQEQHHSAVPWALNWASHYSLRSE